MKLVSRLLSIGAVVVTCEICGRGPAEEGCRLCAQTAMWPACFHRSPNNLLLGQFWTGNILATITHEATVGKIGEDQLFYLMSRGLSEQELSMIVMGFMEPFTKELPMEYAIELNRLIQMEMAGSVG